jgi:hypothetical protein
MDHILRSIATYTKLGFTTIALFAVGIISAHAQNASTNSAPQSVSSDQDIRQTLNELKQLIQQQAVQIQQQQREIDALRQAQQPPAVPVAVPVPLQATVPSSTSISADQSVAYSTSLQAGSHTASGIPYGYEQEPALYLKLGNAIFTPGGWVDFTSIYRTTDVGSGFTTALASIPFNNTAQGALSENRLTAANSRLSLRVDENIGKVKVYGYGEMDFNGSAPGNVYVSTNSDVARLRVFYLNLTAGKWDILGGQSWSLLTPNRSGLSPFLSEIYNTVHLDTAYNAGIVYARQAQLRVVYHFKPNFALGLSAENPQQFSGSAVTFPAAFSTAETDINSSSGSGGATATPNLHPDVVAKLALDHQFGDRNWHLEIAGLLTPVAIATTATSTKPAVKDKREDGGISVNANLEVVRGLHLIENTFWSDGGGRYIGALGPQFVVAQHGSVTAPLTVQLVHAGAGLGGVEYQVTRSTLLSAIYGGAYFDRVFSVDPGTSKLVGYGFAGSAGSNNRFIQEGSFATVTNVFHNPSCGAVQIITQFSCIERTLWYVAPGSPQNAHFFENYFDIRYVLP